MKGLQRTADTIADLWAASGKKVWRQKYRTPKGETENLAVSFGPEKGPRLIVGAHYDTCEPLPGADDNASGVAGLTELIFLLKQHAPVLKHRVDFVAYSTEEPPYFGTDLMGSAVHAKALKAAKANVLLMLSLEMIGYFTDQPKSQKFPLPGLSAIYPDVGNYIVVVGNMDSKANADKVVAQMKTHSKIGVHAINAPEVVPGIDFSDHRSFWKQGYPALMITDTAFLRNANYHTANDTPEKLNYEKMAEVVNGIYAVLTGWP